MRFELEDAGCSWVVHCEPPSMSITPPHLQFVLWGLYVTGGLCCISLTDGGSGGGDSWKDGVRLLGPAGANHMKKAK